MQGKAGSLLGSVWDGVIQWIDAGINAAVDVVAQTGQRVVNWVRGKGFMTNEEILDVAVEAALASFTPDTSQVRGIPNEKNIYDFLHDIYAKYTNGRYNNEVASETLKQVAKLYGMTVEEFKSAYSRGVIGKEFGTETAHEVANDVHLEAIVEEIRKKAQQEAKTAQGVEVKEAGFSIGQYYKDAVKMIKNLLGIENGYYKELYTKDGKDWVRFEKRGEGFEDYCQKGQQDHKYVTKEFAEIVAEAIEDFHDKTGKTVYLNDFSPEPGKKSVYKHHDREYDRGYVVDVKWVAKDDKMYSGDFDKCKVYDREATIKLIESLIDSAKPYIENGNYSLIVLFNDNKVITHFKNNYINEYGKSFVVKYHEKHADHLHIQLYKVK